MKITTFSVNEDTCLCLIPPEFYGIHVSQMDLVNTMRLLRKGTKDLSPYIPHFWQWIVALLEKREEPNIIANADCRRSAFKFAPATLYSRRYKGTDCIPFLQFPSIKMESCRLDMIISFTFCSCVWFFEMIPILIARHLTMAITSSWLDLLATLSIASIMIARPAATLRHCDELMV